MPTCVPVRDMRDTANFLKLVKGSAQPIVITKNGYDECVVMTSAEYDHLVQAERQAQLYLALLESELSTSQDVDPSARSLISQARMRYIHE